MSETQHQYRNIVYLSDTSGTGFWRHIQQIMSVNCISNQTNVYNTYTQYPILDKNYYKGCTSINVQRWITPEQANIFCNFFKPITNANNSWLLYHIDDDMYSKHIPLYNRGRKAFENEEIQSCIKTMLNTADFVVVTTDKIKQTYHEIYGVPLENIIAMPNLLPRWWFDDRFDPEKKLKQFNKYKARPRIGIVSSLSHYNIENVRVTKDGLACRLNKETKKWETEDKKEIDFENTFEIKDDIDDILDCIRSTVNDFQWVFFGYVPPKLQDLVDKKKIEYHPGISILNYASKFDNLNLQAVVAPIAKTEFNYCKSHIKYMEGAILGVPVFATDCLPYSRVMEKNQLFSDSDDLKNKLTKLKFMSNGAYAKLIEKQWVWFNSPWEEGDVSIRNYWLEDNIHLWLKLFKLPQKGLHASYSLFKKQYEEKMKKEKEDILKTTDNGAMIVK